MKNKTVLKDYKKIKITLVLSLIFLVFLFIPSGDDFAWGSSIGVERLHSLFKNYNGRYAGNLLVLILTRSNILRTITISFTLVGIVYFVSKLLPFNKKNIWIYTTILLLAMPLSIFTSTIPWTSGFCNYVMPTLITLYLFKLLNSEKTTFNIIKVFAMSFIVCLFMENITLYILFFSFAYLIYDFIKNKKIDSRLIVFFIGSLLGTIFMFSNGAYYAIATSNDTYRTINQSNFFDKLFYIIIPLLLKQNFLILIFITTCFIKLEKCGKIVLNNKIDKILFLSLLIFTIYSCISFIYSEWQILAKFTFAFDLVMTATYFIACVYFILTSKMDALFKKRAIFWLISIAILVAPLLFVNPIGGRCFYIIYIFQILFAMELLVKSFKDDEIKNLEDLSILIIAMMFIYYITIYGYIYFCNLKQIKKIQGELSNGVEEITLYRLPYNNYIWDSDMFANETLSQRYKLYYNIDDNVNIYYEN